MHRRKNSAINPTGRAICVLLVVLLCAVGASAQLEVGDNVKMNLTGDLGYSYNGGFGNADTVSSHSSGLTGSGNLTGYYFHPNFISFDVRPYYDRSQANSDSQVITRSTGMGATLGLFGGSRFPGSISFGKDMSNNSQFQVAGVPSVVGDSKGQNFGISWSALVPDLPTLSASYSAGSNESSFDGGATSEGSARNFNLSSNYRILGFGLQGNFSHSSNTFTTPSFLTTDIFSSSGSGTSYGASAQHSLPLHGGFNLSWSHNETSNDNGNNASSDSYNTGMSITPWRRISLYQNLNYTTNIVAAFSQSVLNGAGAPGLLSDINSNGLYYTAGANYHLGRGISLNGHFNHRVQTLLGGTLEDTQFGGSVNYNLNSRLFGFLYFGLGIVDTASKVGNEGTGLNATVGMTRKVGHWDTSADFNYAQDIQTQYSFVTTSNYTYGVSARRRINQDTHFGGSFRTAHSGLVTQEGNGNLAESASGFLSWKKYSFSSSYSQSSGTAVINSSGGLTPTVVGSLISNDFILFNARSYGANVSTRLFRRMSVSGGYSKFTSSTTQSGSGLLNSGEHYGAQMQYRLRKFSLVGGLSRSSQAISTVPGGPRVINSYYLSLSRWFNVF